MHAQPRKPSRSWLIFVSLSAWGLFLVSCVTAERTVVAPPQIAGAKFVGTKECAQCHDEKAAHFASASHARLGLKDDKGRDIGCEACHGPGSMHIKAGGGAGTIVNPKKSPATCFQCHLDKRGQFSLPNSHQVLNGKMSCGDCHDPHEGNAIRGSGASLEAENETCTKCHTAQKGPFIFPHQAMREGCTACHSQHGSINAKMLVARDGNLCLRCHLQTTNTNGTIFAGGEDHRTRLQNGTCWSVGCHEAVHGSNVSKPLRF